jgi:hypothetical protein
MERVSKIIAQVRIGAKQLPAKYFREVLPRNSGKGIFSITRDDPVGKEKA